MSGLASRVGILIRSATGLLLDDFLREVYIPAKISLRPATVRQIELVLSLWGQQLGRAPVVADLTTATIRVYLAWQAARTKAATVNSKRAILIALWNVAADEGLTAPAEPRRIRRLPANPVPPQAWSIEQVRSILAAVESLQWESIAGIDAKDWFRAFCLTAYCTGERRGALLAVAPSAVDSDRGTIAFWSRKAQARICPLLPEAIEAIGRISGDRDKLFPWPWSGEYFSKRLRQLFKSASVPHGRGKGGLAHKFRRTCCTLTEANGGDGARIIGDTRAVAEAHYLDRSHLRTDISFLPRP